MSSYKSIVRLSRIFLIIFVLNIIVTTTIQRFKCPHLSETRLFLLIPRSFFWKFMNCSYYELYDIEVKNDAKK